ncbi:MAG TPA: DUF2934 domain-containing protein [Devosia sp.]|nr:DUF2934 domain-containing protein [Devosia sp.]
MPAAHPADETAIREQAYLLWEQEGRPHGREMEFWTRAEVALAGRADGPTDAAPARSASSTPKHKAAASAMKAPPAKAVKGKSAEKGKSRKK